MNDLINYLQLGYNINSEINFNFIFSLKILKYEWPKNWPTFISDIVGASKTNETVCQNNMEILKLLR